MSPSLHTEITGLPWFTLISQPAGMRPPSQPVVFKTTIANGAVWATNVHARIGIRMTFFK